MRQNKQQEALQCRKETVQPCENLSLKKLKQNVAQVNDSNNMILYLSPNGSSLISFRTTVQLMDTFFCWPESDTRGKSQNWSKIVCFTVIDSALLFICPKEEEEGGWSQIKLILWVRYFWDWNQYHAGLIFGFQPNLFFMSSFTAEACEMLRWNTGGTFTPDLKVHCEGKGRLL